MLSVPKKMNSKFAPPLFVRAPINMEMNDKFRPSRTLLSRGRRTKKKDDEVKNETISSETTFSEITSIETDFVEEPKNSARMIKLNWNWEDEQMQDEDPLLPGEIPNQQLISSKGGKRLRN